MKGKRKSGHYSLTPNEQSGIRAFSEEILPKILLNTVKHIKYIYIYSQISIIIKTNTGRNFYIESICSHQRININTESHTYLVTYLTTTDSINKEISTYFMKPFKLLTYFSS